VTTLPLKPDQPTLVKMGILAAYMLFPEDRDAALRRRCIQMFQTDYLVESIQSGGSLKPSEMVQALISARDGFSQTEFQKVFNELKSVGYSAGMHLYNSTMAANRGEKRAKADSLKKLYTAKTGRSATNSKHPNREWERYRPASTLWAAHICIYEEPKVFPCERSDVDKLIHYADAFRRAAETIKTSNGKPILEPGDAFRVPEEMAGHLTMEIVPNTSRPKSEVYP
jgi:hypothetical protein